MNKILLILACILSPFFLCSCSKADDIQPTDNSQPTDSDEAIVIGEYETNDGKKVRLLDITNSYNSISYVYPLGGKPIKHIAFENLPKGMKEIVISWGVSFPTKVFRSKWKGETVYHLLSMLQNEDYGVYHESGENYNLYQNPGQYVAFIEEQEGTECVLILKGEIIKDSTGAKNDLVGMWCNDWQHLTYVTTNGYGTDVIQLYPNLPV